MLGDGLLLRLRLHASSRRGFTRFWSRAAASAKASLLLSALPYAVAACANLAGGAASDALVRRLGPKWGRRSIGIAGLGSACLFTIAAMLTQHQLLTIVLLSLVYGAITFQQSGVFGVCLDIGGKHAGSMVGLMNTSAQVGGLVSSVAYGYIVERFDSYDAPFVPMAAALVPRCAALAQDRRLGRFERGAAGGRCRGASAVASRRAGRVPRLPGRLMAEGEFSAE